MAKSDSRCVDMARLTPPWCTDLNKKILRGGVMGERGHIGATGYCNVSALTIF